MDIMRFLIGSNNVKKYLPDDFDPDAELEVSANYIITRNTKDFQTSIVSAITPEEWLKKFK